jgi:hypothetical protein
MFTTLVLLVSVGGNLARAADISRQEDVAKRGAVVMPFDLNSTVHIFTKTANGGIQKIITRKPNDEVQVRLVRNHLKEIADQFSKGDYSGPSSIHGDEMPGLSELKHAQPGEIKFQYGEVNSGAEIRYTTDKPKLIAAIHTWFDSQLSDHGSDAMAGHHHSMAHMKMQ